MSKGKLTHRVVPSLLVRDIDETKAFYERLGFEMTGFYPGEQDATWIELERDGVTLQFHCEAPKGTPQEPVFSGTFYLYPQNLDALVQELRGKVDFARGPEEMDYGMREFAVQDPNGYFLAFAEPGNNK